MNKTSKRLGLLLLLGTMVISVRGASAQSVGGHVGVAVPLVTVGHGQTDVRKDTIIVVPIGIGIKLTDSLVFDFETAVVSPISPVGANKLIVDPGLVYNWGSVATGLRLAFQLGQTTNVGMIPLVNVPLVDLGRATWFLEAAFPTFYESKHVSFTAVLHSGFGF